MNQMTISRQAEKWMENSNLPYLRINGNRFVCTPESTLRAAFFSAFFTAGDDMLWAHFTFPVAPHEDELPDIRYALDTINAALKTGCVCHLPVLSTAAVGAGVKIRTPEDVGRALDWMMSFCSSVIEESTVYIARILMNGRALAPVLNPIPHELPENLEPLDSGVLLNLLNPPIPDDEECSEADDEEEYEYEEPERIPHPRLRSVGGEPDAAYRSYRRYLDAMTRTMSGNDKNRLTWYAWLNARMDLLRLDMQSDSVSHTMTASLPVRPMGEEIEKIIPLIDGMNRQLKYGAMLIDEDDGLIGYRLRVRETDGKARGHLLSMRAARELMHECADAILRALFDDSADSELALALCREGIRKLNEFCREENIHEYTR